MMALTSVQRDLAQATAARHWYLQNLAHHNRARKGLLRSHWAMHQPRSGPAETLKQALSETSGVLEGYLTLIGHLDWACSGHLHQRGALVSTSHQTAVLRECLQELAHHSPALKGLLDAH
eukprot:Blabericola_migrator_1__1298@NODE_1337_length_4766_cov_21_491594_g561_i1_p2_GENE_NODE_1337_length_4766_cov_21_491594_g561_i1NODE_1337_length_4766_cov_21_491594_g561_i1_p2_ORF_typecomplete_len120_score17_30_NODE_1337_length_4766_cov_21_491594_g561_i136874046